MERVMNRQVMLAAVLAASVAPLTQLSAQQGATGQTDVNQPSGSLQYRGGQGASNALDATRDPATVRRLQQALSAKGYDVGEADGRWGPRTRNALSRFQQAEGMTATGTPDSESLSALG